MNELAVTIIAVLWITFVISAGIWLLLGRYIWQYAKYRSRRNHEIRLAKIAAGKQ